MKTNTVTRPLLISQNSSTLDRVMIGNEYSNEGKFKANLEQSRIKKVMILRK